MTDHETDQPTNIDGFSHDFVQNNNAHKQVRLAIKIACKKKDFSEIPLRV